MRKIYMIMASIAAVTVVGSLEYHYCQGMDPQAGIYQEEVIDAPIHEKKIELSSSDGVLRKLEDSFRTVDERLKSTMNSCKKRIAKKMREIKQAYKVVADKLATLVKRESAPVAEKPKEEIVKK